MRELSFEEVGSVSGGEIMHTKMLVGTFVRGIATFGINVVAGVAGNFIYSRMTSPSPSYGNGNGATGPGYSGAGIGGSVSEGSSGSSHFG